MEKRLFVFVCLAFLLLFTIIYNKSIDSKIKILSSLFFIFINFMFYIKFKKCFSEDKSKNEKQLKEKKKQKEELKKEGFNKINYQDKINTTTNNIKNKFKNLFRIFFKMTDRKDNNFKIYNLKKIKTFSLQAGAAEKIILLKDGRLAFSIYNGLNSILIYNTDNYSIHLKIDNLDNRVKDLIQSKTGNIITSLISGFILVIKLTSTSYEIIQKINAHIQTLEKTIEIKDGRLISCSEDKTMKIWKYNNNQYILENVLCLKRTMKAEVYIDQPGLRCCNFFSSCEYSDFYRIDNILELKNNIIVSTPIIEGPIIFWNIKKFELICQIKDFYGDILFHLKKLSNKLFILGGTNYLYLFSSLKYNLINKFEINSIYRSICCLPDGSILTGHKDGKMRQYSLINNELKFVGEKKCHNDWIIAIIQLKEDLIISSSDDKTINIYKNK